MNETKTNKLGKRYCMRNLVFGEKIIPLELLEDNTYVPHNVIVGEDTHWGPLRVDIKPMFYAFSMDCIEFGDINIEDWIDQCVSKLHLSLQELVGIDDIDESVELMCIMERELYVVISGKSEIAL